MIRNLAPRLRNGRVAIAAALAIASPAALAHSRITAPMPCFATNPDFLKVPAGKRLGDVSAVTLDGRGHVWILHRPGTLPADQRAQALPPVVEFTAEGRFLSAFGGPGPAYEWPTVEHSLAIDPTGNVWISGNYRADAARADDMLLEFTTRGAFVRQVGRRGASGGNADRANFHAPGDLAIDWVHRELYVADGYGNRRIAVLDAVSGRFLRSWGAFGSVPTLATAPPPRTAGAAFTPETGEGPADFNGVHGVAIAADGRVYVSDRNNQRIQVFTRSGRYLGQVFVDRNLPSPTTASGLAFSPDRDQRYLYVVDFGNAALVVIDRHRLSVIGRIGSGAGVPPALKAPHLIASDRHGHLFVSDVSARRVVRLTVRHSCAAR